MSFLNESDLRRMRHLAGMRPAVTEDDFDAGLPMPEIDPISSMDDVDDTLGLPDMGDEIVPGTPADPIAALPPVSPIAPMPPVASVPVAPISPIQGLLDQIERELPDVPVSEFKAVIDRIRSIAQNAEDVRRSLVMESAEALSGDWADRASKEMKAVYGIDLEDAGLDASDLARYSDMEPGDFVSWWGNKYDLTPVTESTEEAAPVKKGIGDYLKEIEDETMTIGQNRADAIKTLQQRMGGNSADASTAFNSMQSKGIINNKGTKVTMPAMGDEELTKALTEEPGDELDDGDLGRALGAALSDGGDKVFLVELITSIEVSGDDENEAESFAKEDARQFIASWNYEIGDVTDVSNDPAYEGAEELSDDGVNWVDFNLTNSDDGTYTFDATLEIPVMAKDEDSAVEAAKAIIAKG